MRVLTNFADIYQEFDRVARRVDGGLIPAFGDGQRLGRLHGGASGFCRRIEALTCRGWLRPASPERRVRLLSTSEAKFPTDWSPDGRFLLYDSVGLKGGVDIWALPLEGRKAFPVVQTQFNERLGQFSPDGKWIAYQSDKTGRFEIYVQPFPGTGGDFPVSTNGGTQVRWNPRGRELFYVAADDRLMAVPIRIPPIATTFEAGRPLWLSGTNIGGAFPGVNRHAYMVTPDGQSFVINSIPEEASALPNGAGFATALA